MILKPVEPVVLTGRHVRLEPIEARHADGLRAIAGDPDLWRFMAIDGADPDGFDRLMRNAIAAREAGNQLPFVVHLAADGTIVGSTRYLNIAPVDGGLEIGWTWYARSVWATPVNPECKLLLLRHAFEVLGARRVALRCDQRNRRSHDAILRLGAVKEGVLRRHLLVQDGVIRDTAVFSILDDEWPRVRAGLEERLSTPVPSGAVARA